MRIYMCSDIRAVTVAAAQDAESEVDALIARSRTATFPEERLKWVPRKRYSSRWPIEPARKRSTAEVTAVAEQQPLVEANIAQAPVDTQEAAQRANEKQMRRRSTRRMSRRVSFAPLDDTFMHHSPLAIRSPVKTAATPKRPSPRKVTGSPQKSFTLQATPSRVLFRSPAVGFSSPAIFGSPVKAQVSPPAPIIEAKETETEEASVLSEPTQLIFDQLVPEVYVEPEHETSRRASLHNARRRERRSSGVRRLVDFESTQQTAPHRRHSLFPQPDLGSAGTTNRRHTLDVFSGNVSLVLEEDETAAGYSSAETTENLSEVVVDVGANLDIFGACAVTRRKKHRGSALRGMQAEEADITETEEVSFQEGHEEADEMHDSPQHNLEVDVLGVAHDPMESEMAVEDPDQAAMLVDVAVPIDDDDDSADTIIHTLPSYDEEQDQEDEFAPHDPEGLSTIFEESEMMSPRRQVVVQSSAMVITPPFADAVIEPESTDRVATLTETIAHETPVEIDGNDDQILEEPGQHSDTAEDEVTSPIGQDLMSQGDEMVELVDTPSQEDTRTQEEQRQPSPTPSDDGDYVATPDDDYCGTFSVEELPADDNAAIDAAQQDDTLAVSWTEVASPTSADVAEENTLASTPPLSTTHSVVQDAVEDTEMVPETPPLKGFTPINSRRASQSPDAEDLDGPEQDDGEDDDEDMGLAMDYEPTVPLQLDDMTATAAQEVSEPDLQEDSETEMLRKFVTRVSANKSAKAAATAAALANSRNLRPKRRSGSTGSTTASVTGSPAAKSAESQLSPLRSNSRLPLGKRDANSPSPTKKRKAYTGGDKGPANDLFRGNPELFSAEISPPKSKRVRRKRTVNGQLETSLHDNTVNTSTPLSRHQSQETPEDMAIAATHLEASQPRRSTRSRNARVALKPPAPSANSIALSLIPVRLPGSQSMLDMDKDMPMPRVVSRGMRTTAEEKDLAAVTRVNTRKNKGNSVFPKLVLARQAEDPAGFRLKELKSVFDAREERTSSTGESEEGSDDSAKKKDGRRARKGKGVRWASELVRFQSDETKEAPEIKDAPVPAASSRKMKVTPVPVPTIPAPQQKAKLVQKGYVPPPFPTALIDETEPAVEGKPEATEDKVEKEEKPAPVRRTRASRLQPPTPVNKNILSSEPSKVAPSSASVVKMATRRTRIGTLGMGVNGTPAPKRRSRGAA
jgi:hypothetical protein